MTGKNSLKKRKATHEHLLELERKEAARREAAREKRESKKRQIDESMETDAPKFVFNSPEQQQAIQSRKKVRGKRTAKSEPAAKMDGVVKTTKASGDVHMT
eukprot:TRINITY_DN32402_c0_g1_i1.p3 TRINITY_DN32402_c0_g1~~TRINITY_DN32402_c0_g1_i1.p3  ORF type:complete len:115 (-),score=28.58 TRINITY_DN32402_c0_g1_i1:422-724(-)